MDYGEELAKARNGALRSAWAGGSPRCAWVTRDEGDTVLVLFWDRTEVAEAEYFREFESCTVRWNRGSGPALPGSLSPKVIEGVAGFLKAHRLDWDGG